MNNCWCDEQGPAEAPETIIEAMTNAHRALHDLARELIWPFRLFMDRKLTATQRPILETYRIERPNK